MAAEIPGHQGSSGLRLRFHGFGLKVRSSTLGAFEEFREQGDARPQSDELCERRSHVLSPDTKLDPQP